MKPDPADVPTTYIYAPKATGPGSGKAAWVEYARRLGEANEGYSALCDAQSETIRELQAEVELLRRQIAARKPKGGRPRIPDDKANAIERDLAAGASRREVAKRRGVSPMTVTRIARRVEARARVEAER